MSSFWCELDTMIRDHLVDLAVLVPLALGVSDEQYHTGLPHLAVGSAVRCSVVGYCMYVIRVDVVIDEIKACFDGRPSLNAEGGESCYR